MSVVNRVTYSTTENACKPKTKVQEFYHITHNRGQKDPITCYLNFLDIYAESKDFDPGTISAPEWYFLAYRFAMKQRFQRETDFFLTQAERISAA